MDILDAKIHAGEMAKLRKPPLNRPTPPVYVAEWLEQLGVDPVDLVKAHIISEGYLSLLRNGKKINPSNAMLFAIGKFLEIDWTDLFKPPPSSENIAAVSSLHSRTLDRLRRQ